MMSDNPFSLCYNLYYYEELEVYLPEAYISFDKSTIQYVQKKATKLVLEELNTQLESYHESLLTICDALSPNELFKQNIKDYSKKKKLDSKSKNYLLLLVQKKVDQLLNLIAKHELPLSVDLSKEKTFYLSRIVTTTVATIQLIPSFKKTDDGMDYTLFLNIDGKKCFPKDKKITILNNLPAWLSIDGQLYRLENINANKIKPFFTKTTIQILQRNLDTYFQKIIKDVVKKVSIEAEGFHVIVKNKLTKCTTAAVYDFMHDKYLVDLHFHYEDVVFEHSNNRTNFVTLNKTGENNYQVIHYKRNCEEEDKLIQKFIRLGFSKTKAALFIVDKATDSMDKMRTIHKVFEQSDEIKKIGIGQSTFELDGKTVQPLNGTVHTKHEEKQDWFDLKMKIKCGDFSFNFSEIIPHIQEKNRYYQLPDGTYFLIPVEWFSTYEQLSKFGTTKGAVIQLPKSNFTVLQKLPSIDFKNKNEQKETLNFQLPGTVKATLRAYQIEGVKWLLNHHDNKLGACLADDMGLGKTLQTLTCLSIIHQNMENETHSSSGQLNLFESYAKEKMRCLIVLPSSLVFNWIDEIQKFTPHFSCLRFTGADRKKKIPEMEQHDIILTSYSIVNRDIEVLKKFHFNYLILDESQQIKNKNSKIFKQITQISTENKISLSGTPIENALSDLWSQMEFINPNMLGTYSFFKRHFQNPIEKNKDENKLEELKELVNPFILRRTKSEVLKDLPELTSQKKYCGMTEHQNELYEKEKSAIRNYLLKSSGNQNKINILNSLMKLRLLSNHPKLSQASFKENSGKFNEVIHTIDELIKAGNKLIIFSSFVKHLAIYETWCTKQNIPFVTLTGSTTASNRESAVHRFQTDENVKTFFISIKAGGTGLNLTQANYVLILDPWWNPQVEEQAISRAHRMGQKTNVHVIRFITENTIEEKIASLQQEKKELATNIVEHWKELTE